MTDRIRPPELGERLVSELLAKQLYTYDEALHEPVKNAEDASYKRKKYDPNFQLQVKIDLISGHPLNPHGKSLSIVDNVTGIVDEDTFLRIGPGNIFENPEITLYGEKHIGKLSPFRFTPSKNVKGTDVAFLILSRNASGGPVTEYGFMWNGSCRIRQAADAIYKPYTKWIGEETFTMVLCPFLIEELNTVSKFRNVVEDLRIRLPRRETENGSQFFFQGKKIEPVPLPTQLVWEDQGISGYFELLPEGEAGGILLYDAETNSLIAKAFEMRGSIPSPIPRPEFSGAIFLQGIRHHQDTGRGGLTSRYLKESVDWARKCLILRESFCPKLEDLMGNIGVISKKGPVTQIIKELVDIFHFSHKMNLNATLNLDEVPDIDDPAVWPNGEDIEAGRIHRRYSKRKPKKNKGSHSQGSGKKDGNPRATLPPMSDKADDVKRSDRAMLFPYKDKAFWVSFTKNMPTTAEGQFATLAKDSVVWFHSDNKLFKDHLIRSSVAARCHFVSEIIAAIELGMIKLGQSAPATFKATVNKAVIDFYAARDEFLADKKKKKK